MIKGQMRPFFVLLVLLFSGSSWGKTVLGTLGGPLNWVPPKVSEGDGFAFGQSMGLPKGFPVAIERENLQGPWSDYYYVWPLPKQVKGLEIEGMSGLDFLKSRNYNVDALRESRSHLCRNLSGLSKYKCEFGFYIKKGSLSIAPDSNVDLEALALLSGELQGIVDKATNDRCENCYRETLRDTGSTGENVKFVVKGGEYSEQLLDRLSVPPTDLLDSRTDFNSLESLPLNEDGEIAVSFGESPDGEERSPFAPLEASQPKVKPPVPKEALKASVETPRRMPSLPKIGRIFNSNCLKFIKRDGSFGPWGEGMLEAMDKIAAVKPGANCFYDRMDFGSVCPGFRNFPKWKKQQVWVWHWASVAQEESSCRPGVTVNGIWNKKLGRWNRAVGLFQLEDLYSTRQISGVHYYKDGRRRQGRDPRFCPHSSANMKDVTRQFECGASILADMQCGKGTSKRQIVNKKSYWEKMRSTSGKRGKIFSYTTGRHKFGGGNPFCK